MAAYGWCPRCDSEHRIPTTPEARAAAQHLRARLLSSGRVDFDGAAGDSVEADGTSLGTVGFGVGVSTSWANIQRSNDSIAPGACSDDTAVSVRPLLEQRGKMFGVLIAIDPTSGKYHELKAFAGKIGGHWTLPGWAAPVTGIAPEAIPSFNAYQRAVHGLIEQEVAMEAEMRESSEEAERLSETDKVAAAVVMTDKNEIEERRRYPTSVEQVSSNGGGGVAVTRDSAEARTHTMGGIAALASLRAKRIELSRQGFAELQRHQRVVNFRGETAVLADVHLAQRQGKGMPAGTGDCCALKLVRECSALGLRPIGIAEFYFGARARNKTRVVDAEYYDACEQRCQPVLGFMLCGLDGGDGSGGGGGHNDGGELAAGASAH